jgi:hypothetical protein
VEIIGNSRDYAEFAGLPWESSQLGGDLHRFAAGDRSKQG